MHSVQYLGQKFTRSIRLRRVEETILGRIFDDRTMVHEDDAMREMGDERYIYE